MEMSLYLQSNDSPTSHDFLLLKIVFLSIGKNFILDQHTLSYPSPTQYPPSILFFCQRILLYLLVTSNSKFSTFATGQLKAGF